MGGPGSGRWAGQPEAGLEEELVLPVKPTYDGLNNFLARVVTAVAAGRCSVRHGDVLLKAAQLQLAGLKQRRGQELEKEVADLYGKLEGTRQRGAATAQKMRRHQDDASLAEAESDEDLDD